VSKPRPKPAPTPPPCANDGVTNYDPAAEAAARSTPPASAPPDDGSVMWAVRECVKLQRQGFDVLASAAWDEAVRRGPPPAEDGPGRPYTKAAYGPRYEQLNDAYFYGWSDATASLGTAQDRLMAAMKAVQPKGRGRRGK